MNSFIFLKYTTNYYLIVIFLHNNLIFFVIEVVAHEMGHNLGMLHDFDDTHGGQGGPCDGTGFMSYGSAPQQWSTCSQSDFLAHYNNVNSQGGWCLPCKSNKKKYVNQ